MASKFNLSLNLGNFSVSSLNTLVPTEESTYKAYVPSGASDHEVGLGGIFNPKYIFIWGAPGLTVSLGATATDDFVPCDPIAVISNIDATGGVAEVILYFNNSGGDARTVEIEVAA